MKTTIVFLFEQVLGFNFMLAEVIGEFLFIFIFSKD